MGKLLGLHYTYEDAEASVAAPPLSETELQAAIVDLAPALRNALIEAAQLGDQERFQAALGELSGAELAALLRRLSDDYRFDVILNYLERKAGK